MLIAPPSITTLLLLSMPSAPVVTASVPAVTVSASALLIPSPVAVSASVPLSTSKPPSLSNASPAAWVTVMAAPATLMKSLAWKASLTAETTVMLPPLITRSSSLLTPCLYLPVIDSAPLPEISSESLLNRADFWLVSL